MTNLSSRVIHGDSKEELKKVESDSVDLLCTDPPYGYSFMGKAWDKALPDIEIFKECFRVLKPGAFAFVMSAPRSDVCSRMAILLENAGFNIAFTPIYWTYASGFPKAMNIGKMVDKRNGRDDETWLPFAAYLKERRLSLGISMKSIDDALGTNTAYSWWEGRSDGIIPPRKHMYERLKYVLNLDDRFDELIERTEAEREIVAETNLTFGYQGDGHGNRWSKGYNITNHATDEAKALDGSYGGFQPKPAVEVIIVAMKPLSEKTYVDQALKNRKGITWLDEVRIPYMSESDEKSSRPRTLNSNQENSSFGMGEGHIHRSEGRFPANLLVSDDVLNDGTERKSGKMNGVHGGFGNSDIYGDSEKAEAISYADSGSYSRFFSLDAWAQTLPFLAVPKASKREKNEGLQGRKTETVSDGREKASDNAFQRGATQRLNIHPTVKPLKLMSYLITLGSRSGDTVLDPFLGSGTTAIAAKKLGRKYIGIEREEEYIKIAEARLAHIQDGLFINNTQP